jgi:hypothetical protein
MKKRKLIPFKMLPASWGLSGKTRQVAEAEYYYEGKDLEVKLAEIHASTEEEATLAKLDIDLKHEDITEAEYQKQSANVKKEPWVDVKSVDVNTEDPKQGFMELDWNDEFVKMLMDSGYSGKSDEDIVNKWFNDVCRTVLLQESADMDFGLEGRYGVDGDVIRYRGPEEDDTDDS